MSDSKFRPLNENERKAITYAVQKGKIKDNHPLFHDAHIARVSYEKMQGGFCVCVILLKTFGYLYRGASRRSYKDTRNDIRGEMLAFSRALLYSRPADLS